MNSCFSKKLIIIVFILFFISGVFDISDAAFNEQMNYQGILTDTNDVAVSDGTKCIKFRLMDAASDGNELWAEEWDADSLLITTTSGLFSAMLGTHQSLSSIDFNQTSLYLEVQYDPGCDNDYEEVFSPRKRLGTVPAAFEAKQLAGFTWESPGTVGSTVPNTGVFTALEILSVTTAQLVLTYDSSNFATFQVDNSGQLTITDKITGSKTLAELAAGGSFQIPAHEVIDPISGEEIKIGDFVLGTIDNTLPDGGLHGLWTKWDNVKEQLLAELDETGSIITTTTESTEETIETGIIGSFVNKVKQVLASFGMFIENGIAYIKEITTEKITIDFAKIKKAEIDELQVNKIQMVDAVTGDVYCSWIERGEMKKVKAECNKIEYLNSQMIINENVPEYVEPIIETTTPQDLSVFELLPDEASAEAGEPSILETTTSGDQPL